KPSPAASPRVAERTKPSNEKLLATIAEQHRQLESPIAYTRKVQALIDGTSEDEHVLLRGNPRKPADAVPRRLLEAISGDKQPEFSTLSGRLELAQQMVADNNPLLARVIVNRVWQHHFSEGLVRTPDDFGNMGQSPTHPELLDWLAATFVSGQRSVVSGRGEGVRSQASGFNSESTTYSNPKSEIQNPKTPRWSLKSLHRELLLSSSYQMSSRPDDFRAEELDPQNKLLHRMNLCRLEGE